MNILISSRGDCRKVNAPYNPKHCFTNLDQLQGIKIIFSNKKNLLSPANRSIYL